MVIKNFNKLSEDEFSALFDSIEIPEKNYAIQMAENYLAYAIALRYNNDCLLSENINLILNGLMDMFNNVKLKEINIDNVIAILKKDYNLNVTNYDPIEITEL